MDIDYIDLSHLSLDLTKYYTPQLAAVFLAQTIIAGLPALATWWNRGLPSAATYLSLLAEVLAAAHSLIVAAEASLRASYPQQMIGNMDTTWTNKS